MTIQNTPPNIKETGSIHATVNRPISTLTPDPRNARAHSKRQVRQIAESIKAFGFNVPILIDRDGKVIAGHGRLEACRLLGWTEVPTVALEHLSPAVWARSNASSSICRRGI